MKVTDLMIGDWVMYNNIPHQIDGIYRITGTVYLKLNVNIASESLDTLKKCKGCVCIEDISPIPLTDDILEKNDFVLNSFDRWMNEEYGIALSTRDDFYFIWDRIQINFVHEFQHAIRFVGWYEFADNFKV